jgi:hypothetical protein
MMMPFRTSIATLVVCVTILALDLAFLRNLPTNDRTWLRLFSLPMLNILAFAFYRGRAVRRLGMPSQFLRGFQVLGWVAVVSYLAWCLNWTQGHSRAFANAFNPIYWLTLNNLDFDTMQRLDPSFGLAHRISMATRGIAAAALVTGLLLLPAVIGGMIARHRHRKGSSSAVPIAQPVAEMDAGRSAPVRASELRP